MDGQGGALGTVWATDLDNVYEAFVGFQRDTYATPFDQGISREGGAVQEVECRRFSQNLPDAVEHRLRGSVWSTRDLECSNIS